MIGRAAAVLTLVKTFTSLNMKREQGLQQLQIYLISSAFTQIR
jgi:hypothetical protein